MELVVLFAVLALLLFGPRRGGGMPSPIAMAAGGVFLLWLLIAYLLGWSWKTVFGTLPQP